MKKLFFFLPIFVFLFNQVNAQKIVRCGTIQAEEGMRQRNPNWDVERAKYNAQIEKYIAENKDSKTPNATITIPVVVHVLYNTTAQNISEAQILSQIAVLNEDFSRTNADAANTPSVWQTTAGNPEIQFCLAQRTPTGTATTGIERRSTTISTFDANSDNVKEYATGGLDAWDVTKYFNIWVCRLGSGMLGYTIPPTSNPNNHYGVVIDYRYFGRGYATQAPFNKGRTSTHEVGHALNLLHIWGEDSNGNGVCQPGECSGTDVVADTPNQCEENYGSPTFPHVSCSNGPNGDMFMNYMDYTDDQAMNMFTNGQSTRMNAVLNNSPYNTLKTSNSCVPIEGVASDAGIASVVSPAENICNSSISYVVKLKNYGTPVLTSVTIKYKLDAGVLGTYNWTGTLATNATEDVTLPAISTTAGQHIFLAYTLAPNGSTDGAMNNDSASKSFFYYPTVLSLPVTEGFESTFFPPANWTLNNPDASNTWARITSVHKTGIASARMNNLTYLLGEGEEDQLITPLIDLTSVTDPGLAFDLAYQLYTDPNDDPNYSDTLRVDISTDCGSNWTNIYEKYSTNLTTATPPYSASQFVPSDSQWRNESIGLTSYGSSTGAFIRFTNISGTENQMYIDNINIDAGIVGVESYRKNNFEILIYPNPSSGKFTLQLKPFEKLEQIEIFNSLGALVQVYKHFPQSNFELDLSTAPKGVYFVKISGENIQEVHKISLK